jgi:two-component system sensor histidine kinase VanS
MEQLEKEIRMLQSQISETLKEKNEYLQNVAHQITSPLNNIKWSIEALEDPDVPILRKQVLLRSIYSQATICVHLVRNFALMSALEAEHSLDSFKEQTSDLDPKLLMINLSNDFQPMAKDRSIQVLVDDDSFNRFANRSIVGIKNLVDQALSNILENAVKYSHTDTKIISSFSIKGDYSIISIQSQGLEISPEDQKQIFNRGFRGKGAKERLPAGTGFGLYIAKQIMNLHGGKIEVQTNGNINTFSVSFPRATKKS